MPRLRNTSGRDYISGRVGRVDAGDTVDVADADAKYLLTETEYFELVEDEDEPSDEDVEDTGEEDADEEEEEAESETFDVDAFTEQNAEPQAEAIRAGEVDEHLDAIAEVNDYTTVSDAIGIRRAELEE